MSELMIAVALWCGQVLVQQHGIYIKPQATTAQVDQCRQSIVECLKQTDKSNSVASAKCFTDQKLPGGKQ